MRVAVSTAGTMACLRPVMTWVPVAVAGDRRGQCTGGRGRIGITGWDRTRGLVCGLLASGTVVVARARRASFLYSRHLDLGAML